LKTLTLARDKVQSASTTIVRCKLCGDLFLTVEEAKEHLAKEHFKDNKEGDETFNPSER